ncbi:MAG: sodium:proton antiporter [Ignavibacteriae bacterium]|nr:sodium:proton antiporter [Ignavibacteriota bacterium]
MILPFVVLLLAIALMPFLAKHWWEKYYPHVACTLGAITVSYYLFLLKDTTAIIHSGIEYVGFLSLVGSLFVVSGGVFIRLRGYSTPVSNVLLLLFGALISNFVGTTGASMILIRPWLRNNKYRMHPYHVVFFIFLVSNIGGALTPIGDPPLFLGYLKGIPFFWVTEHLWPMWLLATGLLLAVFYVIDSRFYHKVPKHVRDEKSALGESVAVEGLHNLGFLLVILVAVFIQNPPFLRELIMILAAAGSFYTTRRHIHAANGFNFHPVKEVGFLFLGLFATMVPALQWLELHATTLGIHSPASFYWGTGTLSAVLDNAPTYLNFLSAAVGLFVAPESIAAIQSIFAAPTPAQLAQYPMEIQKTVAMLQSRFGVVNGAAAPSAATIQIAYLLAVHSIHITAISVAAVFFGAMTYIGNAPNFMVKAIAEQNGARVPSFFGFMVRFSLPVLLPILILVWLIFFMG